MRTSDSPHQRWAIDDTGITYDERLRTNPVWETARSRTTLHDAAPWSYPQIRIYAGVAE